MNQPNTLATSTFANSVKVLRNRKGLRQSDLAEVVGVTRQTILAIEKGRLNPSILISLRIAAALEVPVGSVFFLEQGSETGSDRELAEQFASGRN